MSLDIQLDMLGLGMAEDTFVEVVGEASVE